MIKANETDLNEIRPYNEFEFREALKRLLDQPGMSSFARAYFSSVSPSDFGDMLRSIPNIRKFQEQVISATINKILLQSSKGLTISGLKDHSREKKYLYLSNHRDIICDPSLFTNALCMAGYATPQICLGDNLLANQLIIDLVKMNKGVIVKRNLSTRELFKWSHILSEYINQQLASGIDSVWIAQREGRAKDGNDRTHPGVIKMLTLAGKGETFFEKVRNLHIIPVAISYEYDPCDIYKARELYITASQGSYQKSPHEDTQSMMAGIKDFKGRIHIEVGAEINIPSSDGTETLNKKDQIKLITDQIDRQILTLYRCWPSNYIALDILEGKTTMNGHYSQIEKTEFVERMNQRISSLQVKDSDQSGIRQFYLQAYANPVKNALELRDTA